jgi:hypothetical protein
MTVTHVAIWRYLVRSAVAWAQCSNIGDCCTAVESNNTGSATCLPAMVVAWGLEIMQAYCTRQLTPHMPRVVCKQRTLADWSMLRPQCYRSWDSKAAAMPTLLPHPSCPATHPPKLQQKITLLHPCDPSPPNQHLPPSPFRPLPILPPPPPTHPPTTNLPSCRLHIIASEHCVPCTNQANSFPLASKAGGLSHATAQLLQAGHLIAAWRHVSLKHFQTHTAVLCWPCCVSYAHISSPGQV